DLFLTTRAESHLRPSANLLVASSVAGAAGADANATANVNNAITVNDSIIKGNDIYIQSGRDSNAVPNLIDTNSNAEITTISLYPSIAVPVVTGTINESNTVHIQGTTKVQALKDANLLAIEGLGGNSRARTSGMVMSLSLVPYGLDVPDGGSVN